MKNKQGFTLIEVIVTLAIIGVILIIALPRIGDLRDSNKDKKYEAYKDSFLASSKLYVDSEAKDMFGEYNSGCAIIKYNELKEKNLVKDFGDWNVKVDEENTFVEVRKANDFYHYSLSLVLIDRNNDIIYEYYDDLEGSGCTMEEDVTAPEITVNPNNSKWVNKKNLAVKIKIHDKSGLNKNIQIRYYWINANTGVRVGDIYSYNYHNKAGKTSIVYTIPVKHNPDDSGQYKLVVEPNNDTDSSGVMDVLGNRLYIAFQSSGIYKIDNTPPSCGAADGSKTTWTNSNFKIIQHCSDAHSQCERESYSNLFSTTTKTSTITIKDNAGNKTNCPVNVYLDKDKPTCGSNNGTNKWTGNNRTVSVNCNDKSNGSGCSKASFSKTFSTTTKTSTITIKDVAGNTNSCPVNVYVDKTKPSCGGITGANTSWTKSNRKVTVGCNDSNSGCSNPTFSKTFNSTTKIGYITIKDKVGNTNSCAVNAYVDKTAPTCGSVSGASTSWTNRNRTITVGCNDSNSGCGSSFSKTFSSTAKTGTITIKDKVGNTKNCSVNVYIDKTAPTCGSVSGASTSWTNQNRTITVGCNDSNSGCNGNFSKTFSTSGKTDTVTISDRAGNTRGCSVNKYIDKVPPEITYSYHAGSGWKNESIDYGKGNKFSFYYRDTLSGLSSTWYAYTITTTCNSGWKAAGGTLCPPGGSPYYRAYKVKDNAGNYSDVVCSYTSGATVKKYGPSSACSVDGHVFRK